MVLWQADIAAQVTQGKVGGNWQAERVVIDSRAVQPGDLFVALIGERLDAHHFVAQALEAGAVAAMVSQPVNGVDSARLLHVQDTMVGLETLGTFARERFRGSVIGVTGSVGKTSAKEMIAALLRGDGSHVHATEGNYNNHIGVPLTLANLPESEDFAVIEMGMNHAGEIDQLTRFTKPHVALITAIEAAHMEFFDSVEGIAHAKMEICAGLVPDGRLLLPADSEHFDLMQRLAESYEVAFCQSFGVSDTADYRLIQAVPSADGMDVTADLAGYEARYTLGMLGQHWAVLSVAALGAVQAVDGDQVSALKALTSLSEPVGRGAVISLALPRGSGYALLIDDSYNASPASMKAAIHKLQQLHEVRGQTGRKIAVLGEMLELGESAEKQHAALASLLLEAGVEQVFLCGALMQVLKGSLPADFSVHWQSDVEVLTKEVLSEVQAGDTLLVKGSHGSKVHLVAEQLQSWSEAGQEEKKKHAL